MILVEAVRGIMDAMDTDWVLISSWQNLPGPPHPGELLTT
jgi:hypothetical protein